MTRKQALLGVLENISKQKKSDRNLEIIEKLKEIANEMPFTEWSKATIFDTLEQFAIDNGRNPKVSDLRAKGMPPHPVIKHRFNMTAKEFLDTYFPTSQKCNSRIFGNKSKEEWLEFFVNEYKRIKPSSAEEYNSYREKNSPSWASIAKMFSIERWNDFKKLAKVPDYYKKIEKLPRKGEGRNFKIIYHSDVKDEMVKIDQEVKVVKEELEDLMIKHREALQKRKHAIPPDLYKELMQIPDLSYIRSWVN